MHSPIAQRQELAFNNEAMDHGCVTYNSRSFQLNGKPFLILSGSVHYIRVHPSRWQDLFQTFIDAKLNTVETYVFWSAHEQRPGPEASALVPIPRPLEKEYSFSGRADLFGFIAAAESHGLKVILRIGPYVCAEVSYGGFPFRLRDVPDIAFRTFNKAFMFEIETWIRYLTSQLRKRRLLAGLGGPIILVQLENEYSMVSSAYGDLGVKYLQWVAGLQRELDFTVPGIMCYGAADGVVETINSFYAHEHLPAFRAAHPDQPPVWTECWTGWYDVWGAPHHRRDAAELCYAVARFFAAGGAGVNYYMWMGGTNWGRDGMYLQKSSYDYDAPIDEFYRHTPKSKHLTSLHNLLLDHFAPKLETSRMTQYGAEENGSQATVFVWSDSLTFICNDTVESITSAFPVGASAAPITGTIFSKSVQIYKTGSSTLLFDTAKPPMPSDPVPLPITESFNSDAWTWVSAQEPVPSAVSAPELAAQSRGARTVTCGKSPVEQLRLTLDTSDYCFYTADYEVAGGGEDTVRVEFQAADFAIVFLDGMPLGTPSETPWEDRFSNRWTTNATDPGFGHAFTARVEPRDEGSVVSITVLVSALGLVKGDWQLGGESMTAERKGLLSEVVLANSGGKPWTRIGDWVALPKTHGECVGFPAGAFEEDGGDIHGDVGSPPRWWRTTVRVKRARSWVVDLGGMGKGTFWVNGVLIGRYWTISGTRPRNGFLKGSPVTHEGHGKPCQTEYHVPEWVVSEGESECELNIVLFEELGHRPEEGQALLKVVVE